MAAAISLWQASSPDAIEADLAAHWRDVARSGPVSRALMSNLVVVRVSREAWQDGDPANRATVVADVAERHPVRAILLDYTLGAHTPCAPEAAYVGLLTFGSPPSRYGVELIALRTACAEASIPSIVGRLAQGAVPTTVWWLGDLSAATPPVPLTSSARQFVYDSASCSDVREGFRSAAAIVMRPHAPDIADLAWRRLRPMRDALVHALNSERRAGSLQHVGIDIRYRSNTAATAWLVAGWLHSRLGSAAEVRLKADPTDDTHTEVRLKADPTDDAHAEVRLKDPTYDTHVGSGFSRTVIPRQAELIVTIEGQGWKVAASMEADRVAVTGSEQAPFERPLSRETEAEAVAAELQSLGHDTWLHDTVRAAALLSE